MKISLLFAAFATLSGAASAQTLTVYTYDSFVPDWGPGPAIEAAFEAECACDLVFVAAGDGAALLGRLQLEGQNTDADIVLGLDTSLIATARETGLFAPHTGVPDNLTLPIDWTDDTFLPFDWGYFAFVYDRTTVTLPPTSFTELLQSDYTLIIQDPRSSTPGLGLLMWVKHIYGDNATSVWQRLAPRIVTVTKGWSEAYGLFLEGEADFVLSYTTSPLYHQLAEQDDSKAAAIFSDGHYMQVEVAGILASTEQRDLADQFMAFISSPAFQREIPMSNWMYPVAQEGTNMPSAFADSLTGIEPLLFATDQVDSIREQALEEWRNALSQ